MGTSAPRAVLRRLAAVALGVTYVLALTPFAPFAVASPAFPGAKRRAEPTGRWYVTVEGLSDRCALVERATGSAPLDDSFRDTGSGHAGLPGPDPVRAEDRVVVRARLGGYPWDFLPASDGSGFAAVTLGSVGP